jgi:hypothetical protein
VAQTLIAPKGIAFAGGEAWSARSAGAEITPGSPLHVVAVDGLELVVEPGEPSVSGDASAHSDPVAPDDKPAAGLAP